MSGTRQDAPRLLENPDWRRRPRPGSSALLLAAVGCLGIATQIVVLRELMAAYGGNELSAGVTVAVWILCEALGAWLAGSARASFIVERTTFLCALSVICSLISVPAAVLARPLLGVLPGETLSIPLLLLATFAVVFLPAASHGALFVAAAAIHAQPAPDAGPIAGGVGSAYVWEGIGTALAGLVCFLLLNRMPSLSMVALSALPLVAAAGFGQGRPRTKWTMWTLGLGVLALLVLGLPAEKLAWGAAWRGQRVTAIANSPYGKIVRLERAGQRIVLYDGLPVATAPTTGTERVEELALLPVLCHPAPRRVLVLGQDLAIPITLARFRPDIEVTTVQLDPAMMRAVLSVLATDTSVGMNPSTAGAPSFSYRIADPLEFLGRPLRHRSDSMTSGDYDCIILTDAAPTSLGASRLFTAEFYRLCRSRLAPGGILAVAGPGNPASLSPDLVALISTRQQTIMTAFRYALPVAADFPLLLASDRRPALEAATLFPRLARLSLSPRMLDSAYLAALLDPFRQRLLAAQIDIGSSRLAVGLGAPSRTARLSTSVVPREFFLNMVRENRLVSPGFGALYERLGGMSPDVLPLLMAALLLVGLVGALYRRRRALATADPAGYFSRGFAVLTSGFSGASVSSLLVFTWQVRFGSVFSGVALLVTAFMLGTVLGGLVGTRLSPVRRSSFLACAFTGSDLALASCAAATLLLIRSGQQWSLLLGNGIAGACLGFQFAAAGSAATHGKVSSAPRRAAGVLTGLDLTGGSLGGILTALVIVPVLGLGAAALFAGGIKLASALVQSVGARPGSQPRVDTLPHAP